MQQTKDTRFSRETTVECAQEIEGLLNEYYTEVSNYLDMAQVKPNLEVYRRLEEQGHLGIFTVRVTGELKGFMTVLSSDNPHYRDSVFASCDVLFVSKENRKGLLGYWFLKYVMAELKALGVETFTLNSSNRKPLDKVLIRLGFKNTEKVYSMKLGEYNG